MTAFGMAVFHTEVGRALVTLVLSRKIPNGCAMCLAVAH